VAERSLLVKAVVVDFDGTICPQDVSEELLKAFAPPGWWDIDLEFQRGAIGSRECLVRQASLLKGTQSDMLDHALANCRIDPTFPPFVDWARGAGIEVAVASDGLGFYLEPMLRAGGVDLNTVLTNGFATNGGPAALSFPNAHPECAGCGTCKMRAVLGHRERFGPVAFVGEGHSDRYGALFADLVFAKKHLVDICLQDGVRFQTWETFDDVRAGLGQLAAVPGPVSPERCPGWEDFMKYPAQPG
jgi:2-hydroxy-3-keto-5-methylthiopentenyl-1-phosphate phosphatase